MPQAILTVDSYYQNVNTKISFEGKVSLPWIALYCSDVPVTAKDHKKKKSINQPHFKKKLPFFSLYLTNRVGDLEKKKPAVHSNSEDAPSEWLNELLCLRGWMIP